jgi:hypothetical protein
LDLQPSSIVGYSSCFCSLAALLARVAVLPLKYAAAQQNATMPQTEETMTEAMIKAKVDQFKLEHLELTAVLDKVQSMNATQTLKPIVGIHVLERILDAHARNILLQAAQSQ